MDYKFMGKVFRIFFLTINILLIILPLQYVSAEEIQEDPENFEVIIVSLGDSYSSGEGIEPFYGQDENRIGNSDWIAHRSTKCWPSLLTVSGLSGSLGDHRNENWFFVAASGATTSNLCNQQEKEYNRGSQRGTYYLEPQLAIFDELEENSVNYVTLTIGGNDMGFSRVIETAVVDTITALPVINPRSLSDTLTQIWVDFYKINGTKSKIENAYGKTATSKRRESNGLKEEKAKRVKNSDLIYPFVMARNSISEIAALTELNENQVKSAVESLLGTEMADSVYYLLNVEKEKVILSAISSILDWDKRLKPVKEIIGEEIEYFEIRIAIKKNGL